MVCGGTLASPSEAGQHAAVGTVAAAGRRSGAAHRQVCGSLPAACRILRMPVLRRNPSTQSHAQACTPSTHTVLWMRCDCSSGPQPPAHVPFEPATVGDAREAPATERPRTAAELPRFVDADRAGLGRCDCMKTAELTWLEAYARAEMLASNEHVRR